MISSTLFIGRIAQINHIMSIIDSTTEKGRLHSFQRVLHVTGTSGIGKTFLLKECEHLLKKKSNTVPIYLRMEKFVGRTSKWEFIVDLLKEISNLLAVESPFSEETPSAYEYANWTIGVFRQLQENKAIVCLIDEIDSLTRDFIEALEDHLLSGLINEPNIIFIFASRVMVTSWKDFSLRPAKGHVLELGAFSEEETAKQIQRHYDNEQISEDLIKKVYSLSNGSPGNNEIILKFAGTPPQIRDELAAIQACNQELRKSIEEASTLEFTNDDLRCALDGLCILQDFERDEEAPIFLRAHHHFSDQTRWTPRKIARLLQMLQLIEVGPGHLIMWNKTTGALSIEKQTKQSLETELKLRDKKLWQSLHKAAIKMYQQWAKEYNNLHLFISKVQYHQEQLQQF